MEKTVYSHFCKWRDDETFLRISQALGDDSDMETLYLDSTSVKAHQHSAGAKKGSKQRIQQFIGTSRGGKTTKLHAIKDGLSNPVYFQLSGGKIHDSTVAVDVLSHIDISGSTLLAYKAY